MTTKIMTIDDVFGEDVSVDEMLNEIRFDAEDVEGATLLEDKLSYNEGWYNYSEMKFDYNGNRYSIEYKEHTSDNVSDMDYLPETFVFLGKSSEMSKKITKEDVARMEHSYLRQIGRLNEEISKLRETEAVLKMAPKRVTKEVGELLIDSVKASSAEKDSKGSLEVLSVGEMLVKLGNRK